MGSEPGAHFQLNNGNKGLKDFVKHFDLLSRIATGASDEQVGNARKCSYCPVGCLRWLSLLSFIYENRTASLKQAFRILSHLRWKTWRIATLAVTGENSRFRLSQRLVKSRQFQSDFGRRSSAVRDADRRREMTLWRPVSLRQPWPRTSEDRSDRRPAAESHFRRL